MSPSKIFYFCYEHNNPTGGQKHTYHHVDILNRGGFQAFAFHRSEGFRLKWFENTTRVIGWPTFQNLHDLNRDFIVLPEDLGAEIQKFPGKKVIFNKNLFHGYRSLGLPGTGVYPYLLEDVVAILVVSDHNQAHLQFAYPHQMIRNVRLSINPDIFSWRPLKEKKPQIACIPKNQEWLATLYHTLQSRAAAGLNRGKDFQWVFLVDRTEQQIAQILADSVLFVFPNIAEGLGRMPLEAMLCGCLPVAWRYGPLKETLPAYMNFEWGSILEMAAFIERVMEAFPDRLDAWEQIAKTNRELALTYSVDRQERSVLAAWEEIVRIHGSR